MLRIILLLHITGGLVIQDGILIITGKDFLIGTIGGFITVGEDVGFSLDFHLHTLWNGFFTILNILRNILNYLITFTIIIIIILVQRIIIV